MVQIVARWEMASQDGGYCISIDGAAYFIKKASYFISIRQSFIHARTSIERSNEKTNLAEFWCISIYQNKYFLTFWDIYRNKYLLCFYFFKSFTSLLWKQFQLTEIIEVWRTGNKRTKGLKSTIAVVRNGHNLTEAYLGSSYYHVLCHNIRIKVKQNV